MKNNIKWIITAILFIALIGGASVLYNNLSKDYKGENLIENTTNANIEKNNSDSTSQNNSSEDEKIVAPDFTVLDYDSNEVKLSDFKGKPVVLNFWATWCFYCKEEMPDFNIAFEKYPDVEFLMLNATDGYQETIESAKKYYENEGFDFNIYFDTNSQAVNNYGITGFPTTIFIDKDGYVVASAGGMIDLETLEKGIEMIKD
jgi:thiol-disulfide isomerase/thioredoxin